MGNINVFSGPMRCGKTQKIIDEANRQKIAGKKIQVFKPLMDDRFSMNSLVDRNGKEIPAVNIQNIDDIKKYDADVYLIDEFQFLSGNINAIQELESKGKKFYIAGLNLTTEKKPFGKMGDIMCCADNVQMMTSICEVCKSENATYSYCKVPKDGDVLVGGDDIYIPVCNNCYSRLVSGEIKL
jgi:thymidine kinase